MGSSQVHKILINRDNSYFLKFNTLEIELNAKDGSISEQAYKNTIKETYRQLDIDVDENDG